MVHVALAAAESTGVDAEVIDLRSLVPLDLGTITRSVQKTGRCVVVHEATRTCGFGAELAALVQEHCFSDLEAPVERVTGRSEEHTSELRSLMRISYAVFCLKKKNKLYHQISRMTHHTD